MTTTLPEAGTSLENVVLEEHEFEVPCDYGRIILAGTEPECPNAAAYSAKIHKCEEGHGVVLLCRGHLEAAVRVSIFVRQYSGPAFCYLCHVQLSPEDVIHDIRKIKP